MKEHPILFSGPMVRAILDGTKTQTRRKMKKQPHIDPQTGDWLTVHSDKSETVYPIERWVDIQKKLHCPYGKVGDRLWVQETMFYDSHMGFWCYQADNEESDFKIETKRKVIPSIHMPRVASRILLEITDIRCERLQEISEADAIAEGIECKEMNGRKHYYDPTETTWLNNVDDPKAAYKDLWQSINDAESWNQNPWVWVIEFKRIAK